MDEMPAFHAFTSTRGNGGKTRRPQSSRPRQWRAPWIALASLCLLASILFVSGCSLGSTNAAQTPTSGQTQPGGSQVQGPVDVPSSAAEVQQTVINVIRVV